MIALDEKYLARLLGLDEWPKDVDLHKDQLTEMAVRAVTDFHREGAKVETNPVHSISNARAWIERAYEEGRKEGSREEYSNWQARIKKLFDY